MLIAETVTDADIFLEGLMDGDPVAWGIAGVTLLFVAFGIYQKYRMFSK